MKIDNDKIRAVAMLLAFTPVEALSPTCLRAKAAEVNADYSDDESASYTNALLDLADAVEYAHRDGKEGGYYVSLRYETMLRDFLTATA